MAISPAEITTILKKQIESFDTGVESLANSPRSPRRCNDGMWLPTTLLSLMR